MSTKVEQTDLLGAGTTISEDHAPEGPVTWLAAATVSEHGKTKALRMMGIIAEDGQSALAAWRDAMAERAGVSEREFCRWVDLETSIHCNVSLARFIWAIA